jgi:hypothetical protein
LTADGTFFGNCPGITTAGAGMADPGTDLFPAGFFGELREIELEWK